MQKAVAALKSKQFMSSEVATKQFNVSASTLRHCLLGHVSCRESLGYLQKLSSIEEEELVHWIIQLSSTEYSSQYSLVREMAEAIQARPSSEIEPSLINPHDSKSGPLGQEWIRNFLHQHRELESVVNILIDASRVKETTVEALKK